MAALVGLAQDDWTNIGTLLGEVARRIGYDAAFPDMVAALGELVGVLIDHGVVPGDLGADPDFAPWPGSRQDRVDRVVREVTELGELPWASQVWFHHVG